MKRIRVRYLLGFMMIVGCAEALPNPATQHAQDTAARREWMQGPLMETCSTLPGPESRDACIMVLQRTLTNLRRHSLSREEHLRVEWAKAKGTDETARLWTREQREAWLRGPRTQACRRAPFPADKQWCLNGVERDLDDLSTPDNISVDPPDVRARRAVAHLEEQQRVRAIEQQRAHELELVQQQTAGQALMGVEIGGGLFQNTIAPGGPASQPQPTPALPLNTPLSTTTCMSQQVEQITRSTCY